MRAIHSGAGHSLSVFAGFLDGYFAQKTAKIECLCGSTQDGLDKLAGCVVPKGAVFCKMDVKDFYMNGKHDRLVELGTADIEDEQEKTSIADVLCEMLFHLYAVDPRPECTYQVLVGSGQGQRHSGSLSDFVHHRLAENTWFPAQPPWSSES